MAAHTGSPLPRSYDALAYADTQGEVGVPTLLAQAGCDHVLTNGNSYIFTETLKN